MHFRTLVLSSLALAIIPVKANVAYQLSLSSSNQSPDGFSRPAITVNGRFGAPLLIATKNDRFMANVSNNLFDDTMRESTSIHWHGMFQHRTSTEDGVAFVTQCPISPGNFYNYNFSTAGQTGTYWYHSHLSTQYCDGLRGPLVIYDPQDPLAHMYDIDNPGTVITLGDWYHLPAIQAAAAATAPAPTPDSILFNNVGRYSGSTATNTTVIPVVKGLRYRFRIVNTGCLSSLNVSIDGHQMTVIEADGNEHQPLTVDQLTIWPGQRYSVVVNATQAVGNYWFRAVPANGDVLNAASSTDPALYAAILRYVGAPIAAPTTSAPASPVALVEANMIPLVNPGAPGGSNPAGFAENLVIGFNGSEWSLNGASFIPPSVPVLLQILSGATSAQDLLPSGDVYTVGSNTVVELSIPDTRTSTFGHPFHLHGHAFDVIKSAEQTTPNYINPPRRDVVAVYNGNVTIRFLTDNPGPWVFHCHIDWHFNNGLAIVMAEDPASIQSGPNSAIIPPAYNNLCSTYNALPATEQ